MTLYILARVLLALCAILSLLVARKSPGHRPLAVTLGALLAADLIRWRLAPLWTAAGPYTGSLRAWFHLDQALLVMWRWSIAACLWWTLGSKRGAGVVLGIGAAIGIGCAAAYPGLRQEPLLGTAYPLIHLGAVIAAMAGAGHRLLIPWRLPTLTETPALLLALGMFAQLGGVYWGLDPVRFWPAGRTVSALTYTAVALVLGSSLWRSRKR